MIVGWSNVMSNSMITDIGPLIGSLINSLNIYTLLILFLEARLFMSKQFQLR